MTALSSWHDNTRSPALYVVRHAPVAAVSGVCYGRRNYAAQPDATRQAAMALAHSLPLGAMLYSSPLCRCLQLALRLKQLRPDLIGAGVEVDLQEIDFAQWEGRTWADIGKAAIDIWVADIAHHAPGGGESLACFWQRVEQLWMRWQCSPHDAVWVTHAGVIRALQRLHKGLLCPHTASDWPVEPVACGKAYIFTAQANKK